MIGLCGWVVEMGILSLHISVNRDPTLKGKRRCILKYQVGLLLVQIALHWLLLRCWLVQVERSKVMVSFGSGTWAGIYSVSWLLSWSRVYQLHIIVKRCSPLKTFPNICRFVNKFLTPFLLLFHTDHNPNLMQRMETDWTSKSYLTSNIKMMIASFQFIEMINT